MSRPSNEEMHRIARVENADRAGSTAPEDRRVSPQDSIEEDQHKTNSVSERALDSRDGSRAVSGPTIQDAAFLLRHFPMRAAGRSLPDGLKFYDDNATDNSIGSLALKGHPSDDSQRAVGPDHVKDSLRAAAQTVHSLRAILGSGNSLAVAASNHSHSLSFKKLTRSIRRPILALRAKIRMGSERELEDRVADLEDMVLVLSHLAFDDEHKTAEERERLLVEASPEGRQFRREFLAESMQDFGHGPQIEDKHGFYREVHPDLPEPDEDNERPRVSARRRPLPVVAGEDR